MKGSPTLCPNGTSAHINNRGHSTARRKQQQTNCLPDLSGHEGHCQRRVDMAHTQAGPVMVQEATPAAAAPGEGASAPAAYSKPAQNGNGATVPPKQEEDSDSDDSDVWDTIVEAAEEDGGWLEGMPSAPGLSTP